MSTYCGKDCLNCSYKEELNCSGCKQGPGRVIDGDCKLARCCRDKGHETCETCLNKRNCGMWLDKGSMARQRKEMLEEKAKDEEERTRVAQALAKWVSFLFWMVIPMELCSFLFNEKLLELFPALELPGMVCPILLRLVYAGLLLKMSAVWPEYKRASVYLFCLSGVNLIGIFLPALPNGLDMLIAIPEAILGMVAMYYEYMAHAELIARYDLELSENWHKIWKWTWRALVGIFGGALFTAIAGIVGLIFMLVCVGFLVAASVLKYVYLYRMMKIFKEY